MINVGILSGNLGLKRAGIGNYIYNLSSRLAKETNLTTICYNPDFYQKKIQTLTPSYPSIKFNTVLWSMAVSMQSKSFQSLDILHNPAHFPLPFPVHKRYIMTIHDITALTMPEYHTRYRVLYSKFFLPANIKRASHIIADSQSTKEDLLDFFNLNDDRITVIPLAVDESFRPCSKEEIKPKIERFQLKKPFILFVSTIEPRKNIKTLIRAFNDLLKHYPEYELVIVGQNGWKYEDIYYEVNRLSLERTVRFLKYVSNEDLIALYSAATLFVFPSWYEGFGLPPLEAMSCGTPVIVSSRGSLPEIVGSGGCTIEPNDQEELMEAMEMFIADPDKRKEQSSYNLKRAKQFSWNRCAKETMQVYRDVL